MRLNDKPLQPDALHELIRPSPGTAVTSKAEVTVEGTSIL